MGRSADDPSAKARMLKQVAKQVMETRLKFGRRCSCSINL